MAATYSVGFTGDFTTGENYQAKYDLSEHVNILRSKGYEHLLERVIGIMNRFDSNILNLETPLTPQKASSLSSKKTVLHWADGDIVPRLLKTLNVEAVSLGNNHAMDFDKSGLQDTLKYLSDAGIKAFGAGTNLAAAQTPFVKQIQLEDQCVNLYIIGGFKYRKDYDEDFKFYAESNKAGVFLLTPENATNIISAIKTNDKNSLVVIFPHFGFDLMKTTQLQIDYAKGFIDAGADYVIGHGPHMMNSITKYKNKTILYGLGNFIFPANFQGKVLPYNMAAELRLTNNKDIIDSKLYLYPLYMDNQSFTPQTRPVTEDEVPEFLNLLLEGAEDLRNTLTVESFENYIRIGV